MSDFPQTAARCSEIQGRRRHHWPLAAKHQPREGGHGGQDTVNNRQGGQEGGLVSTGFEVQTPRPLASMPSMSLCCVHSTQYAYGANTAKGFYSQHVARCSYA